MTIEPVTELGSGGALRVPRARAVPLSAPPATYTTAVERYLTGAGIAKSSTPIYESARATRSRHASVRSLERYARPGVDAVARHVAERDPGAHRRR